MKCYQEAYTRSSTYKELEEISDLIIALETNKISNDKYLKRLYSKKFCEELPEELQVKIGMLEEKKVTPY
jgi:RNase H-fold protein (predicted Holliday junction resolvase)